MKKFLLSLLGIFSLTGILRSQTLNLNTPLYGTSGNVATGTSNYAASEAIYYDSEIGSANFITPATSIRKVGFECTTVGTNTTFSSFKIYMQNVSANTTTFTTGSYTTTGYTLVYDGSYTVASTGWNSVTLTTPFVRTPGTNLQVLVERLDNTTHAGYVFSCVNPATSTPNNSRRANQATAITSLTASPFRASIQLSSPLSIDATISSISSPTLSCNSTSNFSVVLRNNGTTNIAAGTAAVTLRLGGPNASQAIVNNTTLIAPNATETIVFNNVATGNAGTTRDSAFVTLAGDLDFTNDTAKSSFITTTTIAVTSTTPAVENVESNLPVFAYVQPIAGGRQLWGINSSSYTNTDLTNANAGSLTAHGGTSFFIHDNYSGASSVGVINRLISNCITLPGTSTGCSSNVSFWLSHDNLFSTDLDSMYLTISTNKGATWTRLAGFGRYDASFTTIGWKQETVSLNSYQGQTFQLGFEAVSKYGNVIGLDDITISSSCTSLPVTLVSFKGERVNKANILSWTTANEVNNAGFELERSADGTTFSKIATVGSKATNGNSAAALTYQFDDVTPLTSGSYYRLKQLDKDGKFTYSKTVLIKAAKVSAVQIATVYPNPAVSSLGVIVTAPQTEKVTLLVTDLSGKTLIRDSKTLVEGDNRYTLDVTRLAAGSYILTVTTENAGASTVKFVKQ